MLTDTLGLEASSAAADSTQSSGDRRRSPSLRASPARADHARQQRGFRPARREEHDRHFLSRLDRVEDREVDFALSLYRDHRLVRVLLTELKLPEGVERVALALTHDPQPPHLVLQRDGRFVTCLAAGMSTAPHRVVPKTVIDSTIRRVDQLRDVIRAAEKLARPHAATKGVRELFAESRLLSREDATPLFRLAPLIEDKLYGRWVDSATALVENQRSLLRQKKIGPRLDPVLHAWWQTHWSHGLLCVATFQGGARFLDEPLKRDRSLLTLTSTFSRPAMSTGSLFLVARGQFANAKAGKRILPSYKTLYRQSTQAPLCERLDILFGLLAIGLRNKHERAEVKKVLSTRPAIATSIDAIVDGYASSAIAALDDDGFLRERHRDSGRRLAVALGTTQPVGSDLRFEHVEDVPDDLAFPLALQTGGNFIEDRTLLGDAFARTAYAATAAPEELYLPARYIPLIARPYHRSQALRLLEIHRSSVRRTGIARPCR